jgi:hypothetical protein
MSHSLSQLTSRVSRLAEQVQRAGVGSCRKNHTPMPLVFTIREGEPYPTLPEQPSHCGVRAPAALRPDHHSPYPGPTVTMPGRPLTRAIKRAGGAAAREGRAATADAEAIAAHYCGSAPQWRAWRARRTGAVIFTSVCAVDVAPRSSAGCVTRSSRTDFFADLDLAASHVASRESRRTRAEEV